MIDARTRALAKILAEELWKEHSGTFRVQWFAEVANAAPDERDDGALTQAVRRVLERLEEIPASEAARAQEEELRVLRALHKACNRAFGWGNESALHAYAHVETAVTNLRCDVKAEVFLREAAERRLKDMGKD